MIVFQVVFLFMISCLSERLPDSNAPTQNSPNTPGNLNSANIIGGKRENPQEHFKMKDPNKKYCLVDGMTGDGTAENPLLIENEQQLIKINKITNNFWSNGCHFKLINDLDFSNKEFLEPIGDYKKISNNDFKVFKGHFHGNQKSIKNLTIKVSLEKNIYDFGLFSSLVDSYISNLTIKNIKFDFNSFQQGTIQDPLIKIGLLAGTLNILSGQFFEIHHVNIETQNIDLSFVSQRLQFAGLIGLIHWMKLSYSMNHIKIKINEFISNNKTIAVGFLNYIFDTLNNFENLQNINIDIKKGIEGYRCLFNSKGKEEWNQFYTVYLSNKNVRLQCDYCSIQNK